MSDLAARISSAAAGLVVSASSPDRRAYARDLWPRHHLDVRRGAEVGCEPAVVAWPESTAQVAALVRFAVQEGFRVVPFGAGSGVCAAVAPDPRTIVVDVKKMSSWRVEPTGVVDLGPGAMGITLEEDLQRLGHTMGHFPSSILCSTVGGWIAARGAGQCSGRYGKIEDMVAEVECVLGTGEVVTFRRRFDGPDLIPLIVGSEGTLGVITRARLRIHPDPETRAGAAFSFRDARSGWEALRALFQAGLRPAVTRLYDPIDSFLLRRGAVKHARRGRRSGLVTAASAAPGGRGRRRRPDLVRKILAAPGLVNALVEAGEGNVLGGCTLILVFEGAHDEAHEDCERGRAICSAAGGSDLGGGPARQWLARRYSVSYGQSRVFRAGAFSDTMEVAAPWSKLGALYEGVRDALAEHVMVMAHLSHAYPDGCSIYFTFVGSGRDDTEALAVYDRAWEAAQAAALEAGGTLSHHHGVGRSKVAAALLELGQGAEVLRRVMRAWDPAGVMNPGAVVPEKGGAPKDDAAPRAASSLDEVSLVATMRGDERLSDVDALARPRGLELRRDAGTPDDTIAQWIARGMPGAKDRWSDPVAHPLAGFVARFAGGASVRVRPQPRRAVGPDLSALVVGAAEAMATIESADLTLERSDTPSARPLPWSGERNPAMDEAERDAWQALVRGVGGAAGQRDS